MREGTKELKPIVQEETKEIDYKEINDKIWLNNIKVHQAPVLTINSWCHNHIKVLHKKYPSEEWTAICKIINHWDWQFEMVDMIHPWQKTTTWDVETTDEWMERAIEHLLERWEDLWEWNCILHSHHWMGCFWSNTDDKARLGMNDWRMLMRAVVTAYKWDEITYKGCLNFYKPYPIEIDCDIEYYTDDLYEQRLAYWNEIENRTKEIYNEMVLTDEILKNYKCEYDYDNLLRYLWIDITSELKKNAEVVQLKMPCDWYEDRLEEIMEEAKKKVQEEIWTSVDNTLMDWAKWSDNLVEQLVDAKVVKSTYKPSYYNDWNSYDYNYGYDYKSVDDKVKVDPDDIWNFYWCDNESYNRYYHFNKEEYPTKWSLCDTFWLDNDLKLRINPDDWLREVWNNTYKEWSYLWDELDEVYNEPENYK